MTMEVSASTVPFMGARPRTLAVVGISHLARLTG